MGGGNRDCDAFGEEGSRLGGRVAISRENRVLGRWDVGRDNCWKG